MFCIIRAQEVATALALAEATSAAQVILVSTQPGAAPSSGGGFFGGLFGGPKPAPVGKPLDKLSKVEQQVRSRCGFVRDI